jgi:rod shape determining protein RodA
VAVYLVLVFLGWLNIYSSSFQDNPEFSLSTRYGKQMIMIGLNIILFVAILFLDVNIIPNISYFLYGFFILTLIAVLFLGDITGGSKSWFEIGSFKLQPAEFAKLAAALAIARFIGNDNFKTLLLSKKIFTIGLILVLPAFLILLQGDAGSALVFSAFILVLYRSGLSFWWLLIILLQILVFIAYFYLKYQTIFIILMVLSVMADYFLNDDPKRTLKYLITLMAFVLTGLLLSVFFYPHIQFHQILFFSFILFSLIVIIKFIRKKPAIFYILFLIFSFYMSSVYSVGFMVDEVLEDHQRTRINVLFGKESDLTGVGYNVHQSKIAIGSGGFFGKGYMQGTQTKYDFVPEQDTDFIFCTVGEEWGFLGTTVIIILFTFLFIRIVILSERQKSTYSRIFGYALAAVLFFHFSINIAMTIGLAPVIGIPLPFFSYGGSSLFAFSIFLFLFLRLDAERNTLLV